MRCVLFVCMAGDVMQIDKNSQTHLYIQIAADLRRRMESGEYPVGGALPTEHELCAEYGVSRYPMRQAMALLVKEGILSRTPGKGTFVNDPMKQAVRPEPAGTPSLALALPSLFGGFGLDIVRGFEKTAALGGYTMMLAATGVTDTELDCLNRLVNAGARGIVVFPCDDTRIDKEFLDGLISRGVYFSVVDRNPGFDHIDYVGSDNSGGGYLAARHMKAHGFGTALFVADSGNVSSVRERYLGFQKGAEEFGIKLLNGGYTGGGKIPVVEPKALAQKIEYYSQFVPFAVLAENDGAAICVMEIVREAGLEPGRDVGIIGFDNMERDEYLSPKLTSVAQSGLLIGEAAAKLAMQKLETGSSQSVRHILPTQLIARESCGERMGNK